MWTQADKVYSEGHTYKIIWAARDVLELSMEQLMEVIGRDFYTFIQRYDYQKVAYTRAPSAERAQVLRIIGRTFPEFLNGLDELHEYLRFSFRALKPPSFYCENQSRTGVTLHYR